MILTKTQLPEVKPSWFDRFDRKAPNQSLIQQLGGIFLLFLATVGLVGAGFYRSETHARQREASTQAVVQDAQASTDKLVKIVTDLLAIAKAQDTEIVGMQQKLETADGWIRQLSSDLTVHVVDPLPECVHQLQKARKGKGK